MNPNASMLPIQTGTSIQFPLELSYLEIKEKLIDTPEEYSHLYAARDLRLQRDVLVKVTLLTDNDQERLIADARAIAGLQHHVFAKTHSIDILDEKLFVVTEAIEGQSITDWTQQHLGQGQFILNHVLNLAMALAETQRAGLLIRDLRTQNLRIDSAGRVRIQFLECLQRYRDDTHSTITAKPISIMAMDDHIHYMAPERFTHEQATPASEVFALGVITYYLCVGNYPYVSLSGLSLIAAQVQVDATQWPWPSMLSPSLRELVTKMTTRDAAQRYSITQVVDACKAIRDSEISTSPSTHILALQNELDKTASQRRQKKYLGLILCGALLSLTAWQTHTYWRPYLQDLRPYSEALELERANALLDEYAQLPRIEYLDQASTHFSEVLKRSPQHAEAVAGMAYVFLQRYQSNQRDEIWLQKAMASTQLALQLNADLALTQIAQSRLLQWHHKLDEALEAAERGMKLAPQNILGWHAKLSILLELGRQKEATSFAEEGAKAFPKDRYMLDLSGSIFLAQGNYQQAESTLKRSLARRPDGRLAYALLAVVLMAQNRDTEALQYIQRGLETYPNPNLYGSLGDLLFKQRKFEEAANAYEKAVSLQYGVTGSYMRWLSFAESLLWTKSRAKEAQSAFEKAHSLLEKRLQLAPDDAALKVDLVHILFRLGDKQSALKLVNEIKAQDLQRNSNRLRLAFVCEILGQRERALQELAEMQKLGLPIDDHHPVFDELRKDARYYRASKP